MAFVFYLCFMKKLIFTLSTLVFTTVTFSQSGARTHVVQKGETLTQIAKRYQTTTQLIIGLNPDAANGLKEHQTLLLPTAQVEGSIHEVGPKETVYSIAKKYNLTEKELLSLNKDIQNNSLQVGQLLIVKKDWVGEPKNSTTPIPSTPKNSKTITVQAGETIYGIAVKNNTTVSQIFEMNPQVEQTGIQAGQVLYLPQSETPAVVRIDGTPVKTNEASTGSSSVKTIIVQPQETIYNISKTYQVSIPQLNEWNPSLKDGLQAGMTLVVGKPSVKKFELIKSSEKENAQISEIKNAGLKGFKQAKDQRELVLLLPFNLDKINLSNKAITQQKLKSDVFLNMTLDFYSGVLIALDSLKVKNYPLQVKILDSKESNRAMDVNALKSEFDFSNTDVVIGPFFQKNVDAISEAFKGTETLVFSPLSTEKGMPSSNQVHTMPNTEFLAKAMLDYVRSQHGNSVVVMHPKSNKKSLFSDVYKEIKVISTDAKGNIKADAIAQQLSKTSKNYVILDSNALETAIDVVNALTKLRKTYDIQMVSLDKSDVLDSSEIAMTDLAHLHLLFPSVTNDSKKGKADDFVAQYRTQYGVNPNRFATRGFDVTYDIITRMFTSSDRSQNIFSPMTEQIENKFEYISENGGIFNHAVYILNYNTDLTINEAP